MAQGYFQLIGYGYLLLAAVVIGVAVWLPRSRKWKVTTAVIAIGVMSIPIAIGLQQREAKKVVAAQEQEQVSRARQRFDELCKTAGEKIYRTVDDVDAVMLLKVRPKLEFKDYSDPMLPGAAMAGESQGDSYIETFLGVEANDRGRSRPGGRGTISLAPESPLPRYRHVDAVDPKEGQRYRYTSAIKRVEYTGVTGRPNSSTQSVLERQLASGPPPRYAVDYEDIINPDDRKMWIAGTTIRVLDQQTGEVLGEYKTYLMDGGMGATYGTRAPWSHASHSGLQCPNVDGSTDTHTRYFVDRVLKIKRGE